MPAKLMEYFNKSPRIGTLSTSSKDGKVNVACFGSPHMIDEKTVVISTAKNRTFANLEENPNAVYMIMDPGKGVLDWKGVRVYLKVRDFATSGEVLDTIRSQTAKFVGDEAAKMIYAAVTFEVDEVRHIVDLDRVRRNPSDFFYIYKSEAMKKSALTNRTVGITEEFITKMLGQMPDLKAQTHKSNLQVQKGGRSLLKLC